MVSNNGFLDNIELPEEKKNDIPYKNPSENAKLYLEYQIPIEEKIRSLAYGNVIKGINRGVLEKWFPNLNSFLWSFFLVICWQERRIVCLILFYTFWIRDGVADDKCFARFILKASDIQELWNNLKKRYKNNKYLQTKRRKPVMKEYTYWIV